MYDTERFPAQNRSETHTIFSSSLWLWPDFQSRTLCPTFARFIQQDPYGAGQIRQKMLPEDGMQVRNIGEEMALAQAFHFPIGQAYLFRVTSAERIREEKWFLPAEASNNGNPETHRYSIVGEMACFALMGGRLDRSWKTLVVEPTRGPVSLRMEFPDGSVLHAEAALPETNPLPHL